MQRKNMKNVSTWENVFQIRGILLTKKVILNMALSYYIKPANVTTKRLLLCIAVFALNLMN